MAETLEDILRQTTVDFSIIAELARGLAGEEEYRKKYEPAYKDIAIDGSFAKYHVETPVLQMRNIGGTDKTLNGRLIVKQGGFHIHPVIEVSYYLPGQEKWTMTKVNNGDLYVQTLGQVIKNYESSLVK